MGLYKGDNSNDANLALTKKNFRANTWVAVFDLQPVSH